jgi:hypothetical protein
MAVSFIFYDDILRHPINEKRALPGRVCDL